MNKSRKNKIKNSTGENGINKGGHTKLKTKPPNVLFTLNIFSRWAQILLGMWLD